MERITRGVGKQILHQERHPGERRGAVHRVGVVEGTLESTVDDRIQSRVAFLHTTDRTLDELATRHVTTTHRLRLRSRVHEHDVLVHHSTPTVRPTTTPSTNVRMNRRGFGQRVRVAPR